MPSPRPSLHTDAWRPGAYPVEAVMPDPVTDTHLAALRAAVDEHRLDAGRCGVCGIVGPCPELASARAGLAAAGVRTEEWVPTLSGAPVRV